MADVESRLVNLEISLAHLQRSYDQLNEVVVEQSVRADRMLRRIEALEEQVRRLKEKPDPGENSLSEKPPHY